MGTLFSQGTENVAGSFDEALGEVEPVDARPAHQPVDSNSVRWVLAANVAFWLVVYVAGRSFF